MDADYLDMLNCLENKAENKNLGMLSGYKEMLSVIELDVGNLLICPKLSPSRKAEKVLATAQHCFPQTFSEAV